MADFQRLLVDSFKDMALQEASLDVADDRLPEHLSAANVGTDDPLVLAKTSGVLYSSIGLHPNFATNDAESAILYDTALAPSLELGSFIRFRTSGSGTDFKMGPATRIQSDGIGCYTAQLTWDAGNSSFKLEIIRYETAGTRTVLKTVTDALTELPVSSGNFDNRFYALGIKAEGAGATVTIRVYLELLYFTEDLTISSEWDLNGMIGSMTEVDNVADSSASRFTSGAHGVRWKAGTLSASEFERVVDQWGAFVDISSTRPSNPVITAIVSSKVGQSATVTIDGFSDSEPLDTHHSTRYLLYDDSGTSNEQRYAFPLVDSGFLTGSKLSYTIDGLTPGQQYRIRVQVKDDDGDISDYGEDIFIADPDSPSAFTGATAPIDRPAADGWPTNGRWISLEPGATSLGSKFATRREGTPTASTKGPRITRYASVPSSERRRFSWRDPSLVGGGPSPLYDTVIGTMVFIRWPDVSGASIWTRATASIANGYYVTKTANGSNWDYALYQHTLDSGGTAGPGAGGAGPYTATLLTTISVAKILVGSTNGERVLLVHQRDPAGIGTLGLYINGYLIGAYANANQGGNDPGHQWSAFEIDDTNGDWDIIYWGQIAHQGSLIPAPIEVVTFQDRNTGAGMHQTGPYMDPWDIGVASNIWWQQGGSLRFKSGTIALAYCTHWPPSYSNLNYGVKAGIYGNNGVLARFTSPDNYISAVFVGGTTLVLAVRVAGVFIATNLKTVTYVAGADIDLRVFDDPNSSDIWVQVFYNGTQHLPASGDSVFVVSAGQLTDLAQGRGGIVRSSGVSATSDEQVADSFEVNVLTALNEPATPTIDSAGGDAAVKVSKVLTSSSFTDPDGDSHAASQWQVVEYPAGVFTDPLFDSGEDVSNLTSISVLSTIGTWRDVTNPGLDASTQYHGRVRHKDGSGLWSDWSTAFVFSTGSPSSGSPVSTVTATFPAAPQPSQAFTQIAAFRTLITQFDTGKEQRRAKWTRSRKVFQLRWGPIIESQMDTLWDFYLETGFGALNAFNWLNPKDLVNYLVRFQDDSMSRETFEADLERGGLTLIEVIL